MSKPDGNRLTHGIGAAKDAVRGQLTQNDDRRSAGAVVVGEPAAAGDWNPERAEHRRCDRERRNGWTTERARVASGADGELQRRRNTERQARRC